MSCGGRPSATVAYLRRRPSPPVTKARLAAQIALIRTDRETVAFDVLVNGSYAGHWTEMTDSATVSWTKDVEEVPTERCEGSRDAIVATLRPLIPADHLPASDPRHDRPQPPPFEEIELAVLSPREEEILRMHFGVGTEQLSFNAIGQRLGITRERVRQVQSGALAKLRRTRNGKG